MEGGSHYRKGLWTEEEDRILMDYIRVHGKGRWNRVAKTTGLKRCGKSCRLRWINYLSPNVKKGDFSEEEEDLIIRLHKLLGNRWSLIAGRVPGRTDNQVKNHWNTHLSKKLGIKKGKNKVSVPSLAVSKVGVSSQAVSKECKQEVDILKLPASSKPEHPTSDNMGKATTLLEKDVSPTIAKASISQEHEMSESLVSSFWFSNESLISNPSLMELLDGYSLDMVWNSL